MTWRFGSWTLLLMLLPACGDDAAEGTRLAATLESIQQQVFTPRCVDGCHTRGGIGFGETGLDLSDAQTSFDNLVGVTAIEAPSLSRIEPGQPDQSYLVHKIEGTASPEGGRCCETQMPLNETPLESAIIGVIRQWVSDGAPR